MSESQIVPGPGQNPSFEDLIKAVAEETGDSWQEVESYLRLMYNRVPRGVSLDYLVTRYETYKKRNPDVEIAQLNIGTLVNSVRDRWAADFGTLDNFYQRRVVPRAREARIKAGRQKIYELIHGAPMEQFAQGLGVTTDQMSLAQVDQYMQTQADPDVQAAWTGFTYGGPQGAPSGPTFARDVLNDPIQHLLGFGRAEAMAVIRELDDDEFMALQHRLYQAGLYGDRPPTFGSRNGIAEQNALDQLMIEAMQRGPDISLTRLVDQLTEERMMERSRGLRGSEFESWLGDQDDTSKDYIDTLVAQPIESYESTVDSVSMALMGMTLDPTARRDLANQLRNKDLQTQRNAYAADRFVSERLTERNSDNAELEAFLRAVSDVESGGDYFVQNKESGAFGRYQFMPEYWSAWARQAGLPSNADIRDPKNQDIVARYLATMYYSDYGNWYDVATAWNFGPRRVRGSDAKGANSYANRVVSLKNKYQQEAITGGGEDGVTRDPITGEVIVEAYDGDSEAQRALRVARSDDIYAYSFAQQAREFFSLLGGVV